MQWTYRITAASRPRVLMRLVQIFDQQSLVISSLKLTLLNDCVAISLTVTAEPELAHRVQAKLYNLTDIQNVNLYKYRQ